MQNLSYLRGLRQGFEFVSNPNGKIQNKSRLLALVIAQPCFKSQRESSEHIIFRYMANLGLGFKSQRESSEPYIQLLSLPQNYMFQIPKGKFRTHCFIWMFFSHHMFQIPKEKFRTIRPSIAVRLLQSFKSQRESSEPHGKAHFPDFP